MARECSYVLHIVRCPAAVTTRGSDSGVEQLDTGLGPFALCVFGFSWKRRVPEVIGS